MNIFELCAVLKLNSDAYKEGLENAKTTAQNVGEKIGSALATVAKVGGAALLAAGAGVAALTKEAVANYGEYEQMVGGVQKLYGNMGQSVEEYAKANGKSVAEVQDEWQKLETAQNTVLDNAKKAYATAGMSANQYMDTATSFSAALINSLDGDTQKAAELTDVAMKAISDNYNTFGGDMQNVTNAFQGFAKQNYTMLDNLKLGYGGTKTEMERLIADANEYAVANGKAADLSIDSFADIVRAIEIVQQKQNIAGTTAREAATTIEGSMGMAKSAWENFVTSLADKDADVGQTFGNLVDSASTVVDNVIPVAAQAVASIGTVVVEKIKEVDWFGYMTEVAEKLMTALKEAFGFAKSTDWSSVGTSIMTGIQSGLDAAMNFLGEAGGIGLEIITGLCDTITNHLPTLLQTGSNILQSILQGMLNKLPEVIVWAGTAIATLWDTFMQSSTEFFNTGTEFLRNLIEGIASKLPDIVTAAFTVINQLLTTFFENLPEILAMGANMLKQLIAGIISILPDLIATALELVAQLLLTIGTQLPNILKAGIEILKKLISGILNTIPELLVGTIKVLSAFLAKITEYLPKILVAGITMLGEIVKGIIQSIPQIVDSAKQVTDSFINKWKETNWLQIGLDAIKGIANGIRNGISWVISAAKDVVSAIWDTITGEDGLDEHSPSKKLFGAGVYATEGLINGLNDKMDELERSAYNMAAAITAPVSNLESISKPRSMQPYTIYLNNVTELDGKVIATSVNRVLGAMV